MSTITRDATVTTGELLTDDMLRRFDERAPVYDRENRFFTEDFDELRVRATCWPRCPPSWAGRALPSTRSCASSSGSPTTLPPPRWP